MKSENLQVIGIVCLVVIILSCFIGIAYENDKRKTDRESEILRLKQALINSGGAWYNPTNGQFQIKTNK